MSVNIKTKEMPFLSVVIPAYNETGRLDRTLKEVVVFLKRMKKPYEILVVDDGSKDTTAEYVERLAKREKGIILLKNKVNEGKGSAVKKGMLSASGQYCLFSDADMSTPINELPRMLDYAQQGHEVVIGSRVLSTGVEVVTQPWYRRLMRFLFNKFVKILAVRGIADTQCGFKLFKATAAKDLFSRQCLKGFGFDVEILYLAQKRGWKIKEMPVSWFYSSETKMSYFKDGLKMLRDLLRVRLFDFFGYYK